MSWPEVLRLARMELQLGKDNVKSEHDEVVDEVYRR